MSRLIVVSNRVAEIEEGRATSGGLAVGVLDAFRQSNGIWFGWNGEVVKTEQSRPLLTERDGLTFATIGLLESERRKYYWGFSNQVLWPLLHYRPDLIEFQWADFEGYRNVNGLFAEKLLPLLKPDDVIWAHDYHLIPFGSALRDRGARQKIGFFLHTPFPAYEVLRTLPQHEAIVEWLCQYDVAGFQTEGDADSFRESAVRVAKARDLGNGRLAVLGRELRAGAYPIGIDADTIAATAPKAATTATVKRFKSSVVGRRIVIGVDRLDYSKGLDRRFRDYATFLERHPRHRGRITYLEIATPTRGDVPEYRDLRGRLNELAGEIVGRYSEADWTPIRYLNRNFTRRTLLGFYHISRIALVTPMRDGMNLVAKEYVAAQPPSDPGVLILSPFAGAAKELTAALIANPNDPDALPDAIQVGLRMSRAERQERWQSMFEALRRNDVTAWRNAFLSDLTSGR